MSGRLRAVSVGLLVLGLIVATWARISSDIMTTPASMDETWHMTLSTGRGGFTQIFIEGMSTKGLAPVTALASPNTPPWYRAWSNLDSTLHPPLHVFTLRFWLATFGDSTTVAKTYSVAWGLLTITVMTLCAYRSFGWLAAAYAMGFMALASSQIYLHTQVRSYAMLLAMTAMLLYTLISIRHSGATRTRLIAVAGLSLGMMLSHYFAVGPLTATLGYLLIILPGAWRKECLGWIALAVALYAAMWGPFVDGQIVSLQTGDQYLKMSGNRSLIDQVTVSLAAVLPRGIVDQRPMQGSWLYLTLAAAAVWAICCCLFAKARPWLVIGGGSLMFLILLDVSRQTVHLSFVRFCSIASSLMIISLMGMWASVCLRSRNEIIRHYVAHALPMVVLIAAIGTTGTHSMDESPRLFDVITKLADYLDRTGDADSPVIVSDLLCRSWQAQSIPFEANRRGMTRTRNVTWIRDAIKHDSPPVVLGQTFIAIGMSRTLTPELVAPGAVVIDSVVGKNNDIQIWKMKFPEK